MIYKIYVEMDKLTINLIILYYYYKYTDNRYKLN